MNSIYFSTLVSVYAILKCTKQSTTISEQQRHIITAKKYAALGVCKHTLMTVEIFSCQIKQTELHTALLHQLHCIVTSALSILAKFVNASSTLSIVLVTVSIMLSSPACCMSPWTGFMLCQTTNTQFRHISIKRNVTEYLRHF